eukprot:5346694-Pyramimonas_sp.AAC.3
MCICCPCQPVRRSECAVPTANCTWPQGVGSALVDAISTTHGGTGAALEVVATTSATTNDAGIAMVKKYAWQYLYLVQLEGLSARIHLSRTAERDSLQPNWLVDSSGFHPSMSRTSEDGP